MKIMAIGILKNLQGREISVCGDPSIIQNLNVCEHVFKGGERGSRTRRQVSRSAQCAPCCAKLLSSPVMSISALLVFLPSGPMRMDTLRVSLVLKALAFSKEPCVLLIGLRCLPWVCTGSKGLVPGKFNTQFDLYFCTELLGCLPFLISGLSQLPGNLIWICLISPRPASR